MNMTAFWAYVLGRLAEPSTYRGLTIAVGSIGYYMSPQHFDLIVLVGGIVLGGIQAAQTERK